MVRSAGWLGIQYPWEKAWNRLSLLYQVASEPKGVVPVSDPKNQFIYVLRLVPSLLDQGHWTATEEAIVERHLARLQDLLAQGKLVLAGKTLGMDERTFGIVILEVESEQEAVSLMRNDPSVAAGMMTAELFPYRVALMRG